MSEQASLDFGDSGDGKGRQDDTFNKATVPRIQGLSYVPDFLNPAEQKRTLDAIDGSSWMYALERAVQHYGWRYDLPVESGHFGHAHRSPSRTGSTTSRGGYTI